MDAPTSEMTEPKIEPEPAKIEIDSTAADAVSEYTKEEVVEAPVKYVADDSGEFKPEEKEEPRRL